jgi:hypothetical protein
MKVFGEKISGRDPGPMVKRDTGEESFTMKNEELKPMRRALSGISCVGLA